MMISAGVSFIFFRIANPFKPIKHRSFHKQLNTLKHKVKFHGIVCIHVCKSQEIKKQGMKKRIASFSNGTAAECRVQVAERMVSTSENPMR